MLCKFNLRSNLNLLTIRTNQERSDLRPPNSPCFFSIVHHTTNTVKGAIIERALQLELSDFGLNPNPGTNEWPWVNHLLSLNLNFCHPPALYCSQIQKLYLGQAGNWKATWETSCPCSLLHPPPAFSRMGTYHELLRTSQSYHVDSRLSCLLRIPESQQQKL